ncbi:MAG: flagellar basal body-associated FliL family protein [Pseudomonadota bacterium]
MSAEADLDPDAAPKKKGMLVPLVAGLVLALLGGGGGFWAVTSGPLASILGGDSEASAETSNAYGSEDADPSAGDETGEGYVQVAFVPLETVTISLGADSTSRHLIFSAQLEVVPEYSEEVATLTPRILDVLNSYLRVVGIDELSNPTSLSRLRSQMLHRVQIVTGDGRVRDLLITEFVVN